MDSHRIEINRITDFAIPLTILHDEAIKGEIYEDGSSLDVPDLVHEYWLSAHLGDYIIGCYRLHAMGAAMWQIHVRLLPKYRQKYAVSASKAVLLWAANHIPGLERIMCFIPACHRNVELHAHMAGMRKNGCLEKSYLRSGQLVDQNIFSISKRRIINSIKEEKANDGAKRLAK